MKLNTGVPYLPEMFPHILFSYMNVKRGLYEYQKSFNCNLGNVLSSGGKRVLEKDVFSADP